MRTSPSRVAALTVSSLAVAVMACSKDDAPRPISGEPTTSLSIALQGRNFAGHSVRICGSRPAPDGKYLCNHELSPAIDGIPGCPCFDFDARGRPVDPASNAPAALNGLCASTAAPAASWTFRYFVYDAPGCGGTQLNDGSHNFTCFDVDDIGTRTSPNAATEALLPGQNTNRVLCTTDTANASFAFGSCVTQAPAASDPPGSSRIHCGCSPTTAGTCTCGDGGVTQTDLETGCAFDPTNCHILCTPVMP